MTAAEPMDLEREGWAALSTDGAARPFYERVLADRVLFVLPRGMLVDDRTAVLDSMSGPPWTTFELADERVVDVGRDAAVVAYRASAVRDGVRYEALVTSTYQRTPEGWRLVLHQQTPS